MLAEMLKSVFLMSCIGGLLCLFWLCVRPLTRKLFSPNWQYYIWLTVLLVMVLPVSFQLPQEPPVLMSAGQTVPSADMPQAAEGVWQAEAAADEAPVPQDAIPRLRLPQDLMAYAGLLWLCGTAGVLCFKLARYLLFLRALRQHTGGEMVLSNIPERLKVRRTDLLDTPVLVGLFRPVLYLPAAAANGSGLRYILLHELTHYRRYDLLYKWFAMLVTSVHWFNPLVYAAVRQIDQECEVSCDAAVAGSLNEAEQKEYMNMILDLLAAAQSRVRPLTTQMAGGKKTLKRRFTMIRDKKKTGKFVSVVSVVLALAMLSTTVFASGVLSGLTEENYIIGITNKGERIELVNKPFIENGILYVPLREAIEKTDTNAVVEWNDGRISVDIIGNKYLLFIDNRAINVNPVAGPTFSVDADAAPLLIGSVSYMPFETLVYLFTYDQNNTYSFDYALYDNNGNTIYTNAELGFRLTLPAAWTGQYQVLKFDNMVTFVQSATYEKYGEGSGTLFRIEKVRAGDAEEILNLLGGSRLLYSNDEYAYIFEVPTDVQYPIWTDRDEEDIEIAAEYERLFADVDMIADSVTFFNT